MLLWEAACEEKFFFLSHRSIKAPIFIFLPVIQLSVSTHYQDFHDVYSFACAKCAGKPNSSSLNYTLVNLSGNPDLALQLIFLSIG